MGEGMGWRFEREGNELYQKWCIIRNIHKGGEGSILKVSNVCDQMERLKVHKPADFHMNRL